ncbi:hypothetical protein GGR52DRAFT_327826 [Hypoxylon sp. FL1284]|nr:hypothetical protein GGR52DRAFT_327826 [Hypoxylon sp. FL1284]
MDCMRFLLLHDLAWSHALTSALPESLVLPVPVRPDQTRPDQTRVHLNCYASYADRHYNQGRDTAPAAAYMGGPHTNTQTHTHSFISCVSMCTVGIWRASALPPARFPIRARFALPSQMEITNAPICSLV